MSRSENELGNTITGISLGALIGIGLGLGACVCLFDEPPLFTGDTVLLGAATCGTLGYFWGEPFIDWLKENWWWFS